MKSINRNKTIEIAPSSIFFRFLNLPKLRTESNDWLHLDVLRFVASVGVVWFHSLQFFYPSSARTIVHGQTAGYALFVDLFFTISGVIIAAIYSKKINDKIDYYNFILRRVARLLPLHWLVLIITLSFYIASQVMGFNASSPPDLSISCILHNLFLLNGVTVCGTGKSLVGVTWSISVEMVLYILFPLLFMCINRFIFLIFTFVIISVIFYFNFVSLNGLITESAFLLRGIPSFIIGISFYRYRNILGRLKFPQWFLAVVVFALVISMQLGFAEIFIMTMIWLSVLIAVSSDVNQTSGKFVKLVSPLGQLTYGIYMWHYLFITIIINFFADKLLSFSTIPMAFVALLTYILIGFWSYFSLLFFETPMRRKFDAFRFDKNLIHNAPRS